MRTADLFDQQLVDTTVEALTEASPFDALGVNEAVAGMARLARAAVVEPPKIARASARLFGRLSRIALGTAGIEPAKGDRRFDDPVWSSNPVYRRMKESYLAWGDAVHQLVEELDLDDTARLRAKFAADLVVDAAAPTNTLVGNPAAIREAVRTRGRSLVDGARHALHDLRHNEGLPSMVDTRPFRVGETVAATAGAVVYRNEVLEVLQYQPTTTDVYERPVLVVPPQINKYYILDLAPGRSLFEHAVANGQQVFAVSWRNPGAAERGWNIDTYVAALDEAVDAVLDITDQPDLNLLGLCAGGLTSAVMLGRKSAFEKERVHSFTMLVSVLDWSTPSTVGTLLSPSGVRTSITTSKTSGMLRGEDLGKLFAWMRPNDLVWNYWVNNYLMGRNPPAFDVLSWNVDATNLPAGLHADFLRIADQNLLAEPGGLRVHGRPVELKSITGDAYLVGGLTDHITPWEGSYASRAVLGGSTEFVLCASGHVQTLVCPPSNPKARYFVHPQGSAAPLGTATEWKDAAEERQGSWWDHWLGWLSSRSGASVGAPGALGSARHPVREAAPGQYVRQSCRGT